MDFGAAFRDLGEIDVAALQAATFAQGEEAWREHEHRQRAYDVHHDTASIVLLFCDETWPDPVVTREPGWLRLSNEAAPLIETLVERAFPPGGAVIRAMAAKLRAGGRIAPHIDHLPSFRASHRVHLPLSTNPGVRFTVDGKPCPMAIGRAIEINNQRVHSVMNFSDEDRISFIFDYLPPAS